MTPTRLTARGSNSEKSQNYSIIYKRSKFHSHNFIGAFREHTYTHARELTYISYIHARNHTYMYIHTYLHTYMRAYIFARIHFSNLGAAM